MNYRLDYSLASVSLSLPFPSLLKKTENQENSSTNNNGGKIYPNNLDFVSRISQDYRSSFSSLYLKIFLERPRG